MKATLTFNLPEEQNEFELSVNALNYKITLEDIANDIFRPARKHGYGNVKLNALLENDNCREVVSILEEMFYEKINENSVKLFE